MIKQTRLLWQLVYIFSACLLAGGWAISAGWAQGALQVDTYAGVEPTGPWGETITLSSLGKAAIGLEVATVIRKPLALRIATTGKIQPLPTREFHQQSLISGRVTQLMVNIGDAVRAGQPLIMVDSPEINQLASETLQNKEDLEAEIRKTSSQFNAEIEQAKAHLDLAEANYKRSKKLLEEGIVAQKEEQVTEAEVRLAKSRLNACEQKKEITLKALHTKLDVSGSSLHYRLRQLGVDEDVIERMLTQQKTILHVPITASRPGVITDIQVNVGQSINQSAALFKISDLSEVWAMADVYEDDMARIRPGQKVTVQITALPAETFFGKVSFIGKLVNPETRTLPVGVEIVNSQLKLKPGMFADLSIDTAEPTLSIIVPRESVVERNGHYLVFAETKGGYQAYRVKVGRRFGDDAEILEGLSPGQRVVVRGAFQLNAELLKEHGRKDLFDQPTEGQRKELSSEPFQESAKSNPLGFQVVAVLLAAAFFLGFVVSVLVLKSSRNASQKESGKNRSSDSERLSKR